LNTNFIVSHILKKKVMTKDINITAQEWLDLVFEGKNKEYGAYVLRDESSNRHIKALVIVIIIGLALALLPKVIKSVVPQDAAVQQKMGIVMTTVETPQAPVKDLIEMPKPIVPVTTDAIRATMRLTPPVIVPDDRARNSMTDQQTLTNSGAAIGTVDNPIGTTYGPATPPIPIDPPVVVTDPPVFITVEQPPVFSENLLKWLGEHIKYPAVAIERGIQGKVVLRFVVGPDGSVGNVEVLKSLDPSCDKEAVRVVKSMPKWIPGRQNGNAVHVYYTLPVTFKLQ
jgi:protein TonB